MGSMVWFKNFAGMCIYTRGLVAAFSTISRMSISAIFANDEMSVAASSSSKYAFACGQTMI